MKWDFKFTREDGQTLTIGPPPFRTTVIDGTENGSYSIGTTQNAMLDGAIVTSVKIPPRQIEVQGVLDYEDREKLREKMIHFFSPALSGSVVADRNGTKRKIGYRVSSLVFYQPHLYAPMEYTLRLLCPSYYWESISDYGQNLAAAVPLIGFPLVIPAGTEPKGRGSRKFVTGYSNTNRRAFLGNTGDVSVGFRAVLTAVRGQVVNPTIRIPGTGESITARLVMEKGSVLEISTIERKKTVTLDGINVFHTVARDSIFFPVPIGGATVEYDADDGYTNLDLRLYYTPRYLGL